MESDNSISSPMPRSYDDSVALAHEQDVRTSLKVTLEEVLFLIPKDFSIIPPESLQIGSMTPVKSSVCPSLNSSVSSRIPRPQV
jgi:hypothetical protein